VATKNNVNTKKVTIFSSSYHGGKTPFIFVAQKSQKAEREIVINISPLPLIRFNAIAFLFV
jgi:hypothetical protein